METKGICPVVFIGDKIKTCKDINSLFINPFETKLETDKAREKAIMSIYKNCDNIKTNFYKFTKMANIFILIILKPPKEY